MRKRRGRIPKRFMIAPHQSCSATTWHPQPQKKRPKIALDTRFERKLNVVYKTVGKRELEFDMYYPKTGTKKPCPVIVYTHGGDGRSGAGLARRVGALLRCSNC